MNRASRASLAIEIVLAVVCLACASLILVATADAKAKSKGTEKIGQESMQAYEQQLAGGQIKLARFNPAKHTMRLTLKDGKHVRVSYTHGEEPKLRAALKADGVSVPATVKPKINHKNRYIAAGALVVVLILIVAGVVVVMRRRRRMALAYDE
jgi:ATP-dependent Zn protease